MKVTIELGKVLTDKVKVWTAEYNQRTGKNVSEEWIAEMFVDDVIGNAEELWLNLERVFPDQT